MKTKIRRFFAGGNTSKGFVHFYDSLLEGLDRVFILKGGPGTGKSTIIRTIAERVMGKTDEIWLLPCASDNDSLDGIIIPAWKAAVVDGTAPHVIEPKLPGAVEEYVNLGEAWDSQALALQKDRIASIRAQITEAYEQAYKGFAEALRVHDGWEAVYIHSMDVEKADNLTEELKERFFGTKTLDKQAKISRRFLGAATPIGAVDYIPNLTEDIKQRFFLKGRPGSGKSTMLKKIAAHAQERGFDVEIYHCGFDPDSIDMLIFREADLAIFDSTAPHEHFPEREGDEIIDMYARCFPPGVDEAHAEQIAQFRKQYSGLMKQSIGHLARAKQLHDQLEHIYVAAMDFTIVNQKRDWIEEQLEALSERVSHHN
mgnify:CR=1 FL=1